MGDVDPVEIPPERKHMHPTRPPKSVARESEILACRLILAYLESDFQPYIWKIQEDTGIDWLGFEAARRSAWCAARAWEGREDVARPILLNRLNELLEVTETA
ncbi:hypothetical protein SBI67_17870 [Mycolicibacterium sp. 120266]|uniref:hypothetical protein n=1 Tax=Mycolicibacterium sp. 120266 TaxID=3090601 RepID=UPI00299EA247|nr:hypothetical protein [Mycolicibacterium sp. 120266]MDX1873993.1 hypothetical protein [Mycolicibacterium sp. 120266]